MRLRLKWCRHWTDAGAPAVWIDVARLNASWRYDRGFYIGKRAHQGYAHKTRYFGFGKWLSENQHTKIRMPVVSIEVDTGIVAFTDGRHRFAWLRDYGVKALPVVTDRRDVAEMKRRFGSRRRATILEIVDW